MIMLLLYLALFRLLISPTVYDNGQSPPGNVNRQNSILSFHKMTVNVGFSFGWFRLRLGLPSHNFNDGSAQ